MWRNSSRCDNLENWDNFIASHTAALAQDWIKKKRPGFTGKNEWPTNSPDLNPMDCRMGRDAGFKYREGSWHSSLKRLNCWRKSCAKFDHYYWIFRTRLYVHLKKWTLKFKLLYLSNHTCYFNKICRIGLCGLNSCL